MGKLNHSLLAAATAVSGALCSNAGAQLSTERTYYGTNRAFPIEVTWPGTENPLSIKLMDPSNAVLETKEAVPAGKADLANAHGGVEQQRRGLVEAQLAVVAVRGHAQSAAELALQ